MVSAVADWPDTRFTSLVGVRHPIIAAPMAGAAGPELAIAAIRGGALGSLPCALLPLAEIRTEMAEVRSAVAGPVNLNFFCHTLPHGVDERRWRAALSHYYTEYGVLPPEDPPLLRQPFGSELCELVEELRPAVVSFHFGLPEERLLARVKATGAIVLASATTVAAARWLADQGVDAVIAQGWEAGGHASHILPDDVVAPMALMALLPQVADAIDVPVIAAGGIADARGIAAALTLGASAVQIGTAYLATPESDIPHAHRLALAGEGASRTQFTTLFTGRLARGIPNRLTEELGRRHPAVPPFPHASAALGPLRQRAEATGDYTFSPFWAGQGAPLTRPLPATELTELLAAGALAILSGAGR